MITSTFIKQLETLRDNAIRLNAYNQIVGDLDRAIDCAWRQIRESKK